MSYTPFKMKGNPAKTGKIQGTSSHVSALKMISPVKEKPKLLEKVKKVGKNVKEGVKKAVVSLDKNILTGVEKIRKSKVSQKGKKVKEKVVKGVKAFDSGVIKATENIGKFAKKQVGKIKNRKTTKAAKSEKKGYTEKVKNLRDKMKTVESKGKTVKNSRRLRRLQNKVNKEMGSDVRHKKNILTKGKYKRKVKE